MSLIRGQRRYVGRSYFWNAGGATRPGATSPCALGHLPAAVSPPVLWGLSSLRAAWHSQETPAHSNCQGLRSCLRLHILFGNCFKWNQRLFPASKQFFFKEREGEKKKKRKKGEQQGVWFQRSSHAQLSPCLAAHAPCNGPSPLPASFLPPWAAGPSGTLPWDYPCLHGIGSPLCSPSFPSSFCLTLHVSFSFSYTSLFLHVKGTPFF